MGTIGTTAAVSVLAASATLCCRAQEPAAVAELGEMIVTARRIPERAQDVPLAVSLLSAERIENYRVTSLERVAEVTPGLIVTRGNSGSGADFSLRGIGSNFSNIGIEQSVAVVVDGVHYGQGRIIDEGFLDLERIEILKGPQSLFFGKNSTAGVISITTADPAASLSAKARIGYEVESSSTTAEAVLSGPLTNALRLRLAVGGQKMWGGYVDNVASPGTYTTIDAASGTATAHAVPAPAERDLPAVEMLMGRFTASYEPNDAVDITLKLSANRSEQGGAAWNDRLWQCPLGVSAFPGSSGEACGEGFEVRQNPVPRSIAATRKDMRREDGEPYALYDSYSATLHVDSLLAWMTLTSVTNHQRYDYAVTSDFDFTSVPRIWSDQNNTYRASSQELRARTSFDTLLNFLVGVYYQDTRLDFSRGAVFAGFENSLAASSERYLGTSRRSATDGSTWAGYGQVIWSFLPQWELTVGARYTEETKDSYFIQPYVNPFLAALYVQNRRLSAEQRFSEVSPESTLTWQPHEDLTLYIGYRTGYKSGGFSNSAVDVAAGAGVANLVFEPETVEGVEAGAKGALLDDQLRFAANIYYYDFSDLQVDFFNARTFALITTNAGSVITKGVELEAEYLPRSIGGLRLRGTVAYNDAEYDEYNGPCYGGQTQAQGCILVNGMASQDLSGKPTADSPHWVAAAGLDYQRSFGDAWVFGVSTDLRYSDSYSVSPFAQPLDRQDAYFNLSAALRLGPASRRWQLALIGRNLTDRFIVTYASDVPSTGTAPGGATGQLADQFALFAPARSVTLQITAQY